VLVTSRSSADRAIALARLLGSAAERSGWSERLDIRLGGIEQGAGRLSDAGIVALEEANLDGAEAVCPDLERRPELLEGADFVVCDRSDVADVLVDWDEAGEAEFVCVSEISQPPAESVDDDDEEDDASIADEVAVYADKIDEVLRQVVREKSTD
jgi:hypothetical protein